jgi:hypothetical protein
MILSGEKGAALRLENGGQLKVEETMKRHALPATMTAVPNRRRQFEGTIALGNRSKSKKH